ncbi:Deoxyribose-phosphate aldolase [Actinomyces bovis]|uniref:Deoxyribose-phosphate aldolase n=1 Tax=Actinomyces bovis TaxID=1658 RepID=A0ABY1VM09_9ACTO|nr:deoxyribose-phosphate aldolase [Actinomyces bovis]SPT52716.1 Deoxyribose-phosphate aldolase [Actinomyces bovis]VEG54676.1 Deoxyribose-phosphate aldolase [Actinomyces israelii]
MKKQEVARLIDHTLLKPEGTAADVTALVAEGAALGTCSVCVSPSMLPLETPEGLLTACVVGFPSGAVKPEVKAFEAAQAVKDGVDEVDMVINLALAKEGRAAELQAEIKAVRDAVPAPRILKVIIESAALSDEEIVMACQAAQAAGADFVKTSTGFHPAGGASTHAVALMRATVGEGMGVKASGGIRDAATAVAMIEAGANRLGVSATKAILAGLED